MTSSLIRSGAAALVAALAFAACAGNGTVPSSSLPSNTNMVRVAAPNGTGAPCPLPVGWIFGGPCDTVPLTSTGGKGSLKLYEGFSLTTTIGSNTAKKGTALIFEDATGNGDITGKVNGKKFPLLKGAILYLAALNTGAAFTLNVTPAITIKSKTAIAAKSCTLNQLGAKGKGFAWTATPITAEVKGKTIAFGSVPFPQQIPAGPFFLAFGCK